MDRLLIIVILATLFQVSFSGRIPWITKKAKSSSSVPDGNTAKIIGGSDARPGEFIWQVSLQLKDPSGGPATPYCGGAILDPSHVLTAAHCVQPEEQSTIEVVAGAHNVFNPDGTEQRVKVAAWEYHENFDPQTYNFDIALIRLATPLTFNSRVGSIQLPPQGLVPSGTCVNTGWGNIRNDGGVEYPEVLQKVSLQMVSRSVCVDRYSGVNPITMGMICAGNDYKGSCKGDSGGPLVCKDSSNRDYLAGLVSWGVEPCALDPKYPSVFTNIPYFIDWIYGSK